MPCSRAAPHGRIGRQEGGYGHGLVPAGGQASSGLGPHKGCWPASPASPAQPSPAQAEASQDGRVLAPPQAGREPRKNTCRSWNGGAAGQPGSRDVPSHECGFLVEAVAWPQGPKASAAGGAGGKLLRRTVPSAGCQRPQFPSPAKPSKAAPTTQSWNSRLPGPAPALWEAGREGGGSFIPGCRPQSQVWQLCLEKGHQAHTQAGPPVCPSFPPPFCLALPFSRERLYLLRPVG
uniref:Uncharacterized protein n=1 Tax=Sphaerodactylus townsendi TaxID=933632 RepID=A0ACB8EYM1_9SAUR